jgi:hypothetical protein
LFGIGTSCFKKLFLLSKLNTQTSTFTDYQVNSVFGMQQRGSAQILDNAGNIVLRANSMVPPFDIKTYCFLFNKNNLLVSNCVGIEVDPYSQCSLVRMPGATNSNKYYLFTTLAGKLYYHIIDMTIGASGQVMAAYKNKLVYPLLNSFLYFGNTMKLLEDRATNRTQLYVQGYFNTSTFIMSFNIMDVNSLPTISGSTDKYFTATAIASHPSTDNKNDNLNAEMEMVWDKTSPDQSLYFVTSNIIIDAKGLKKES